MKVARLHAAGDLRVSDEQVPAHERGEADQVRGLCEPGGAQPGSVQPRQPGPARQRPGQLAGDVVALRVAAAGDQVLAGERR
jgi:hypothetical protein